MVPIELVLGGIASVLGAIAAAGLAGKWVWGREFNAMERDRNLWRAIALRSMGHVERTGADALELARQVSAKADGG